MTVGGGREQREKLEADQAHGSVEGPRRRSPPAAVGDRRPLVTGLSGAGRGTAAKVLEDLGWYVADNLPPELIAQMVELGAGARGDHPARGRDGRAHPRLHRRPRGACSRSGRPAATPARAVPRGLRRLWCAGSSRTVEVIRCRATDAGRGITAERDARPAARGGGPASTRRTLSVPACAAVERAFGAEVADTNRVTVSRSATSTGCRWTPTPSWTCGSCRTRTGRRAARHTGQRPGVRDYVLGHRAPRSSSTPT